MESTMVWAGVWTSLAVGTAVLMPVFMAFCRRNLPVLFGLLAILLTMYSLAPSSPEIRAAWLPLCQLPALLVGLLYEVVSRFVH